MLTSLVSQISSLISNSAHLVSHEDAQLLPQLTSFAASLYFQLDMDLFFAMKQVVMRSLELAFCQNETS